MRKEYDFTDSVRDPYTGHFRKQVTIRLHGVFTKTDLMRALREAVGK